MQPQYKDSMEPKFNSDNDSFLLVLKNLNYENFEEIKSDDKKAAIKSGDKKAAIKSGDKKVTKITQQQYNLILSYMEKDKEYGIQDFCKLLNLKETRTKVIMNGLIENSEIETVGAKKDRRYKLNKK